MSQHEKSEEEEEKPKEPKKIKKKKKDKKRKKKHSDTEDSEEESKKEKKKKKKRSETEDSEAETKKEKKKKKKRSETEDSEEESKKDKRKRKKEKLKMLQLAQAWEKLSKGKKPEEVHINRIILIWDHRFKKAGPIFESIFVVSVQFIMLLKTDYRYQRILTVPENISSDLFHKKLAYRSNFFTAQEIVLNQCGLTVLPGTLRFLCGYLFLSSSIVPEFQFVDKLITIHSYAQTSNFIDISTCT
jgi:hypothetical protein